MTQEKPQLPIKEKINTPDSGTKKETKFIIDDERLLFSLKLDHDNTGAQVEAQAVAEGFRRQDHRHVTILGGRTKKLLKAALAKLPEEERKNALQEIKRFLGSLSWEFTPKDIYKVEKDGEFGPEDEIEHRESYINLIDMPAIPAFYAWLKEVFKTDFPEQVAHITLFTKGEGENPRYYGFPISSMADFHQMNPQKFINNPTSHE
jgi:hypothetical protein